MKKILLFAFIALFVVVNFSGCTQSEATKNYKEVDGVIVTEEPARAQGQKSVLGLKVAPIPTVRVGFIGMGMRGPGAVERFTYIEGTEIKALCDLYPDKIANGQKILTQRGVPAAAEYSGEDGWKQLCDRDDIDLVYIATPWQVHTEMALYAMQKGKHVAIEVPAAMSIKDCWALVDMAEQTQRHCMMLENCVYDFFELTTLNMAQKGLFGEVLHVEGGYIHNLEAFWDQYQDNWRLAYNQANAGDVYPTHGLGPACQLLNIHRGDKMNFLVSMSTKSVNGLKVAKKNMKAEEFANGDQTTTLIRTENGKTIEIQHNVLTPRPYSRNYQLVGTEGFANKYLREGFAFNPEKLADSKVDHENLSAHSFVPEDVKNALMQEYKHPIVKDIEEMATKVGGHGGMDFIMDYRLVYCLQRGLPLDEDVYDAAEWSSLTELSALSIQNGSKPVRVPDFTRGDWNKLDGLKFAQ